MMQISKEVMHPLDKKCTQCGGTASVVLCLYKEVHGTCRHKYFVRCMQCGRETHEYMHPLQAERAWAEMNIYGLTLEM